MTGSIQLDYYFDPLCGWCYASAQGLAALVKEHGVALNMKPTGLFMEPRPVDQISDHAYRNDTKIEELTGQKFTNKYHTGVMRDPDGVFSSTSLTLAFVILQELDADLAAQFFHAAQIARYVEGADTSRAQIVADLAAKTAADAGHDIDAALVLDRIQNDAALAARVQKLAAASTGEMQALGLKGVPHLVIHSEDAPKAVSGEPLYAGGQGLLDTIRTIEPKLA